MPTIKVNQDNFTKEVLEGAVLVDFWAPWCGPCKMIGPVLEELSEEMKDKVKVVKINVDECPELADKFGVMGIPALLLFDKGNLIKSESGFRPLEYLKDMINSSIN